MAPRTPAADPAATAGPERTREFLMQHLARFYDFKGLFRWKRRFDPSFEDRYIVYPAPLSLPSVALALIRAQSPAGLRSYLPWARPQRGQEQGPAPAEPVEASATPGAPESDPDAERCSTSEGTASAELA